MQIKTSFGPFDFGNLKKATRDFHDRDIAVFRDFITAETAQKLQDYVFNSEQMIRRDFMMPTSDNTPRHMSVISGLFLNTLPEIVLLYHDSSLLNTIDRLVYRKKNRLGHVTCYDDPLENMVATRLEKPGDTHGYHVDDPALALIICLEAPPEGMGGDVEYHVKMPDGSRGLAQTHLNTGDAYLMRTDEMPHRVMPLQGSHPRSILNLTYDFKNRQVTPNGSATLLFQPA